MKKTRQTILRKRLVPLEILLGLVLVIGAFVFASNADMKKAQNKLLTTVEYMKEQCNNSQLRELASEAKSLLRVTESVEQIRWRLKYGAEAQENQGVNSEILKSCAKDSYLEGLILLDDEGKLVAGFDSTGLGSDEVLDRVEMGAIMDPLSIPEKTYTMRIPYEDESQIDVAAVSRSDAPGVIIGYFYTSADYASLMNNPVRSLVSGYMSERDGIIAVSSGNRIFASNSEALIGTNVEESAILREIMERGAGEKLIHAQSESNPFSYEFGLMGKSQSYYIYAFMEEREVFSSTPYIVFCTILIYLLLVFVINFLLKKAEDVYQKEQAASQEKHMKDLEEKNQQLEEAVVQAEKANAAKSNFLSRMSHDIRTPLNGIVGLLKIDVDHFENQELVLENHRKMKVAADHLLALINDVLQMSKMEDGKIELSHEYVDLVELARNVVTIIKDRAVEEGIIWEGDETNFKIPYPYVYGSPVHLRQIFLNIYGNCIKFNHPGGKVSTKLESIGVEKGICTYRCTITDTGRGMSKEFLQQIFEPFTQEKNDARSDYQGTGLGMAIVKGLVDQMGGSISVTSEEGVGSVFVVTIPFEIAVPLQEEPKPESRPEENIRGLHLLVAEDNELNAEIAETLLEDKGAIVSLVTDGRQALEAFQNHAPGTYDAILMDIMMPEMDGITATREIRSLEREDAKTIPIIAMTANAFVEDGQKCLEAGMNYHLAKPLNMEELMKVLVELCR